MNKIIKSKTIIGIVGLIALLSPSLFGIKIDETELWSYIEPIGAGVFAALALYGRLTAKGPLIETSQTNNGVIQEYTTL